ncbi:uncharacterized protein LOC128922274 [Zeugodacus cucurbitae]|uniref:uncharacterized protein LOC128922274 n=1 Tax=Zeugodacus cucurbitae TaxID=28588 RepID=UPI0023D8EA70|nr:uncharacterized protein LOC128922274 [Zeugodacus cucurbitae]
MLLEMLLVSGYMLTISVPVHLCNLWIFLVVSHSLPLRNTRYNLRCRWHRARSHYRGVVWDVQGCAHDLQATYYNRLCSIETFTSSFRFGAAHFRLVYVRLRTIYGSYT